MTDYGVQPTGYVRKPLGVFLAELEAAMVTEFGPGVIQTEVSPFGQLNGLMADLLNELDEGNLELYQSYDPDEAEGTRLNILARLRLAYRGNRTDEELRRAITNEGEARIDIQDVHHALRGLSGVTYAQLWTEGPYFGAGTVSIAVIGGDDAYIADVIRQYIVPGIATYGNHRVSSVINGSCRSFSIVRPIEVDVHLDIKVKAGPQLGGCPAPSTTAIEAAVIEGWAELRQNDLDVDHYTLRSIIERQFPNIELVSFAGYRDSNPPSMNQAINIDFLEIARLTENNVEVELV